MILYKKFVKTKHRTINIRPFGDLQKGDPGFNEKLWLQWKRDALEDKDSLILGLGDYSNSFRTTMDKKLRKVLVEDSEAYNEFDYMIMKEMQELAKELKPFQDRLIGLHEGHHKHTFANGTTSTQYLCQLLKTKYLGFVSFMRLVLMRTNKNGGKVSCHNIDIFSTHGCGGSSFSFSDLAQLERRIMPFWDADIFIRGHSTKVYCVPAHPLNRLAYSRKNAILSIKKSSRLLVNTGGFMEGYPQDASSYVEEKNIPPCALGYTVITIHMDKGLSEPIKILGQSIT